VVPRRFRTPDLDSELLASLFEQVHHQAELIFGKIDVHLLLRTAGRGENAAVHEQYGDWRPAVPSIFRRRIFGSNRRWIRARQQGSRLHDSPGFVQIPQLGLQQI